MRTQTVQERFFAWVAVSKALALPMQKGYFESFNGKLRDEHLNEHWFQTLHHARSALAS